MKSIKVNSWREIPNNFTGISILPNGSKHWYKKGKCHREDGPAEEYSDGRKFWFLEGQYYEEINLKDYVVLDYHKGKHDLMWYKLLDKNKVVDYPDIPGLITKIK